MKFLGYQVVAYRDIKFPGDWRAIQKDPATQRMRKSVGRFGILQDPIVRKADMQLVCGAHRIGADIAEGRVMGQVKYIDCTDLELEAIRRIENGDRRHDVAWGKTNYVELLDMLEKEEKVIPPKDQPPTVSGREHSPRRRAREKVAQQLGVKSESVRQAERRQKRKKEKEAKERGQAKQVIPTHGIPVNDEFTSQVVAIRAGLEEAANLLARAQGILTSLTSRDLPMHDARLQRTKDELSAVGSAIRTLAPFALCPFCKGIDALQKLCAGCATTGYITKNQADGVPQELWDEDNPVVLVDGSFRPFKEFAGKAPVDDVDEFDIDEEEALQAAEDAAAAGGEDQAAMEDAMEDIEDEELSI